MEDTDEEAISAEDTDEECPVLVTIKWVLHTVVSLHMEDTDEEAIAAGV
jgi:hypothetical protein